MTQAYQNSRLSQETRATLFVILFTSVFILAQLTAGFQLSLFVVAMLVSVVLILWRPRVGLYASVVLTILFERFYTLQPILIGREAYKMYPIDIVCIAIFVAVAIQLLFRQTKMKLQGMDWLFIVFLCFVTLLFIKEMFTTGSGDMNTAFSTWKNYIFYGLLYFVFPLLLQNEKYLFRFVKFFLAVSVVAIMFVLIGIVRGAGLWTEYTPLSTDGVRILAMPHAYYFSMALLGVLFSWQYIKTLSAKGSRFATAIFMSFPLWIVGIVGSLMRHLWIGLIFSLAVMWLILPKEHKKSIMSFFYLSTMSVVVLGIVFSYGVFLFPSSQMSENVSQISYAVSNRFVSLGDSGDTSISWRSTVWREAIDAFSQSMIFGTGFGMKIPVEIDAYREFIEIRNVHNSWLAMLVQTGIVGFGLMFSFLVSLISAVRKKVFESDFLHSARYATLGIFVFQSMIFLYQPYLETNLLGVFFWMNLGVMRVLLLISDTSIVSRITETTPQNLPVMHNTNEHS